MLAEGVGGNGKTSCANVGARGNSVVLPAVSRAAADSFSSAARRAGNRPPAGSQPSKLPTVSATNKGHFARIGRIPFWRRLGTELVIHSRRRSRVHRTRRVASPDDRRQRSNFNPGSSCGAPRTRKVMWLSSCQATWPARAPSCPSEPARVSTPLANVDLPAMVLSG